MAVGVSGIKAGSEALAGVPNHNWYDEPTTSGISHWLPDRKAVDTVISRSPSLTEQVKAHLKQRIADGEFEDGRIPPEVELASELGVSRTTVRDALSRLANEGVVYRRQGSGTFINEHGLQIKSRLEEIWSYEDVLTAHGYEPSVDVISIDEEKATKAIAGELDIAVGTRLIVIEKVFRGDDLPVAVAVNRIPSARLADEAKTYDGSEPLYSFLEGHSDRRLSYFLSEIIPVELDEHTAGLLDVPLGTLATCFDEIGFDEDNTPLVRATSFFRDDLLRFRLIRRKPTPE